MKLIQIWDADNNKQGLLLIHNNINTDVEEELEDIVKEAFNDYFDQDDPEEEAWDVIEREANHKLGIRVERAFIDSNIYL